MTTASSRSVDQWYVRQGTKIRGPFSLAVLVSMKERGRLDLTTEISSDRMHWVAAQTIAVLLGESDVNAADGGQQPNAIVPDVQMPPSLAASHALVPVGARDPSLKCFYSIDGIVHGPVPFAALQQRAAIGQLAPTDYVWVEGNLDWVPALSVADLSAPTHRQRTASFVRANAIMVSCVVCMALLVLGLPTWYVFASSREKQREMAAQAQEAAARIEAANELLRRREAQKKDELARLERERDRLLAHERSLLNERNQTQMQLETIRLSYTQLRVEKIRDERTEARMDELRLHLDKVDRDIADVRAEAAEAATKHQEMLKEQLAEQRRLADTARDIKNDNERTNRDIRDTNQKIRQRLP